MTIAGDTAASAAQPYIAALRAGDLFADPPAYQRDFDTARVERRSTEFDRTLLGVLAVSARAEGRYAIIDGQHRWALARRMCGAEERLVCQVHTGLTPGDEARLFLEIDTGRAHLSWWDRWRARRGQGDPDVLVIDEVLQRHGPAGQPGPRGRNIRAVKALERIVGDLGDPRMLDSVLIVLTSAFGRGYDSFDGAVMHGVAVVLGRYDADELDTDRLIAQLCGIPARQLRARSIALREGHRATVPRLCATVMIERYNAGRGRNVEEFFTRAPSIGRAGAAFNRTRRQRAAIGRRAQRNGHDITPARDIAPGVRQAWEKAQAGAPAAPPADGPPTAAAHAAADHDPARQHDERARPDHHGDHDDGPDGWDGFAADASPDVGVPDRHGVLGALANGRGLRWVMDAYGLDYVTVKALREQSAA